MENRRNSSNANNNIIIHNNNNNNIDGGEILEIIEEDEEEANQNKYYYNATTTSIGGKSELVPISEGGTELLTNTTSLFSIDIHKNNNNNNNNDDDVVYVAVGKNASSMDALQWTLLNHHSCRNNNNTNIVYLIHIFSSLKFIPSPLGGGLVPKSQVSQELVEQHLAQETRKRRELLTKYIDKCTSHMVQVETILVESDTVGNAILELISVLNIHHLVVGISKSNYRKVKMGKGSATVAEQIRQGAPKECELKIVCQGKQMSMSGESDIYNNGHHSRENSSLSKLSYEYDDDEHHQPPSTNSFSCCFKL